MTLRAAKGALIGQGQVDRLVSLAQSVDTLFMHHLPSPNPYWIPRVAESQFGGYNIDLTIDGTYTGKGGALDVLDLWKADYAKMLSHLAGCLDFTRNY